MKVAVVEDNKKDMDIIREKLALFSKNNNVVFEIDNYGDGMEFIRNFRSQYEIVLLDMEMPLLCGMDTAKEIRKFDSSVVIIFVTRIENFAVDGYTVDAAAYLLKPVTSFGIDKALKKAVNLIASRRPTDVAIKTQKGVTVISSTDIYYCEVYGHDLNYHTSKGKFLSHETLGAVEEKLDSGKTGFLRCNKSYLVNLHYVRHVENNTVHLLDGTALHMSRGYKKSFTDGLMLFVTGGK